MAIKKLLVSAIPSVLRYGWNKVKAWYYSREKKIYEDMKELAERREQSLRTAQAAEKEIAEAMQAVVEADKGVTEFDAKLALTLSRIEEYERAAAEKERKNA